MDVDEHFDVLEKINKHIPLREKLVATHKSISKFFLLLLV